MDLVVLLQGRDVEAPVVGGGAKAMHQQHCRTVSGAGALLEAMDGKPLKLPGARGHRGLLLKGDARENHCPGGAR